MEINDGFRLDILERLEHEGPLTSRDLPDTSVVPWTSSGWNNNRNVSMMIEFLEVRGEVAAAGRRGRDGLCVDPALLGHRFRGRAAHLSPLDRLVYDRKRVVELFEFDYQLEMFKPAAKRRWGYYALPILYGDRLVGKVDATANRKEGVLQVDRSTRTCRSARRLLPQCTARSLIWPAGSNWNSRCRPDRPNPWPRRSTVQRADATLEGSFANCGATFG